MQDKTAGWSKGAVRNLRYSLQKAGECVAAINDTASSIKGFTQDLARLRRMENDEGGSFTSSESLAHHLLNEGSEEFEDKCISLYEAASINDRAVQSHSAVGSTGVVNNQEAQQALAELLKLLACPSAQREPLLGRHAAPPSGAWRGTPARAKVQRLKCRGAGRGFCCR